MADAFKLSSRITSGRTHISPAVQIFQKLKEYLTNPDMDLRLLLKKRLVVRGIEGFS